MDDTRKALEHYTRALEIVKKFYGEDSNHPDIASIDICVARVYTSIGRCQEALSILKKALQIYKIAYGKNNNHPHIADCYDCLGTVYHRMDRYTEALRNYELALVMMKAVTISTRWQLQSPNPYGNSASYQSRIAMIYSGIASVYYSLAAYPEALRYLKLALETEKSVPMVTVLIICL